jgi:hypothetical protein
MKFTSVRFFEFWSIINSCSLNILESNNDQFWLFEKNSIDYSNYFKKPLRISSFHESTDNSSTVLLFL